MTADGSLSGATTAESIRGTKVRGSEIWRSRVFPVYAQQEALAQLEFSDTQRCVEVRQRHLPVPSRVGKGTKPSHTAEEKASTGFQFSAVRYFLSLPDSAHGSGFNWRQPLQLDFKIRNLRPGTTGSRPPGLKRQPALKGDPRGRRQRGGKEVKASHPWTPLALSARVQLCSDFFLRTSCGSRNNDSRSLPPPLPSPLKYGNCIIQMQEPLFFFLTAVPSFLWKCLNLHNTVFCWKISSLQCLN